MQTEKDLHNRIPIAVSLDKEFSQPGMSPARKSDKLRLLYVAALAIVIAALISLIAKALVFLINLITNLAFHQTVSIGESSPATNHLGWLVIFIPAIGGIIVGLMALYGSKAIR